MSGTRRTEDFNAIKTRQFILQNPDGTYPKQGSIMTIADQGRLAPSQDITVRNLTVTGTPTIVNLPQYDDISAISIRADTITTRTLNMIDTSILTLYDLCANHVETIYLTPTNIYATGTSSLDHIYSLDISAQDISATHITSQDITATHIVTGTASAAAIYTATIHATGTSYLGHIYSLDISAQDISAAHITSQDISARNITISNSAYIQNVTIPGTADISGIRVVDISATNVTIGTSAYIENANIQNLTTSNLDLTGDIILPSGTVTAYRGDFAVMDIGEYDISGYNILVLTAEKFTGTNVNVTRSLTVNGPIIAQDFSAQDINATSLTLTGTTNVQDINAQDITATSLTVTGGHTSVRDISATSLTVADGHTSVRDISATSLTVADGSTTVKDLSATSLYVEGAMETGTLHTTTITTAEQTVSTHLTINGPSPTAGILTYNDSSGGLLVNGEPVSSAVVLQPVAFKRVKAQTTPGATLDDLLVSYNKFLGVFDSKNIIITFSPVITFASTCTIQFIVSGIPKAPVVFEAGESLLLYDEPTFDSVLNRLNDVGGADIHFSAYPPTWKVTLDISGRNNKIADVSGIPTSSLQVLRYLGFTMDMSSNPFETYVLNGREYISTFKDISDGYRLVGKTVPKTVQYPNELDVPVVDISSNVDPYSIPVHFNNRPTGNNTYIAISFNGSYKLYPNTYSDVSFNGLTPNTQYSFIFNYLDLSNNSITPSTGTRTGTTANIPAPIDLSATSITYNSFRSFWTQPYPGKTYTFSLDLSGRDTVTSYAVSDISNTFIGLYNNTDYNVRIRSFDPAFVDCSSNYSPYVSVHTDLLIVPTPVIISTFPNNNLLMKLTWSPSTQLGISGELYYSFNDTLPYRKVNINVYNDTSYNIIDLSGSGTISCYLRYKDMYVNDVSGLTNTQPYTTSFGFYDMTANGTPFVISRSGITNGVGYLLPSNVSTNTPTSSPWIGYTCNRIRFKTLTEVYGNDVQLQANIYDLSASEISDLYNNQHNKSVALDLSGRSRTVSSIFDMTANATYNNVLLSFTPPVVLKENTLVLFDISGAGRVQVPTFDNFGSSKNNYATSVVYTTASILANFSDAGPNLSAICQFEYG